MPYFPYYHYPSGCSTQGSMNQPLQPIMPGYYGGPIPVQYSYPPPYYRFPWRMTPYQNFGQNHPFPFPYVPHHVEATIDGGEQSLEATQPLWDSPESPQSPWIKAYQEQIKKKER